MEPWLQIKYNASHGWKCACNLPGLRKCLEFGCSRSTNRIPRGAKPLSARCTGIRFCHPIGQLSANKIPVGIVCILKLFALVQKFRGTYVHSVLSKIQIITKHKKQNPAFAQDSAFHNSHCLNMCWIIVYNHIFCRQAWYTFHGINAPWNMKRRLLMVYMYYTEYSYI